MIFNYQGDADQRPKVLEIMEKEHSFSRILDVGGSMNPWAGKYVTHYLDVVNTHEYLCGSGLYIPEVQKAKCFLGDINDLDGWEEIMNNVYDEGKFAFAICTQTLEDIRNPICPLKMLPLVAREGFISVPYKWRELNYVESHAPQDQESQGLVGTYMGYFHHRWIFTIVEKEKPILRIFPKLAFVERLNAIHILNQKHPIGGHELSFFWKDSIEYEIVNNDYLGPNPISVFDMYRNLIEEGI